MKEQGVGARLLRKEDDRLMRGRGQFVANLRFSVMKDVAFVRSPLAHAEIRDIAIPQAHKERRPSRASSHGNAQSHRRSHEPLPPHGSAARENHRRKDR